MNEVSVEASERRRGDAGCERTVGVSKQAARPDGGHPGARSCWTPTGWETVVMVFGTQAGQKLPPSTTGLELNTSRQEWKLGMVATGSQEGQLSF